MTPDEVMALAGDALHRAVAERLFGLKGVGYYGPPAPKSRHIDQVPCATPEEAAALVERHRGEVTPSDSALKYWRDGWGPILLPEYEEDMHDAWEVVERLRDRGVYLSLHARPDGFSCEAWTADHRRLTHHDCKSETAALAVCRGALLTASVLVLPGRPALG